MSTKQTGDRGEAVAAAFLEAQGYVVLERNYRFMRNEVDLVCHDPEGFIVFVEVKARRGRGFGQPEEAVDEDKQRNVRRAADAYLHERRLEGAVCRFDVVGVQLREDREPEVDHIRYAF